MRITTKEVKHEVDGQEMTFRITKMNALHGSYLMKFCAEKFLPLLSEAQELFSGEEPKTEAEVEELAKKRTEKVLVLIPKALASLTEEELIGFEVRCLQTVEVSKPAGWQPVLIGQEFGVEELEGDIMTTLILCYEVVEFNMGSFFGGKGLTSILHRKNT